MSKVSLYKTKNLMTTLVLEVNNDKKYAKEYAKIFTSEFS